MRRRVVRFASLLAPVLLFTLTSAASAEMCFTATIDGAQAGTPSTATGTGLFILNDAETALTYKITYSGLGSAETAAHIHSDAEGGGVVHTLPAANPKIGTWSGASLTAARLADLKAGRLYVNIHTSGFGGGEIRGQILTGPCVETCYTASIDGAQAGTLSTGTGTGLFILNHDESVLTYNIAYGGLGSAETAAHIHSDAEGGGVVHTLPAANPKIGTWSGGTLTAARVTNLKNGQLYVNIHTTGFGGGEIRGQILPGACNETCFSADIDGAQAGTGSGAVGTGLFYLNHTELKLRYNIQFAGLGSAESAAHIHSDAEGGGVVHPLPAGSPKTGVWTNTASPAMTPARVANLKAGQLYVNIHSTGFPGGEIRGQMLGGPCAATGIPEGPSPVISLRQNTPNPFAPSTTILFSVAARGPVALRVYDVNGRLVRTLLDAVLNPADDVRVVWDGRDDRGEAAPSGMYFYRAVTPGFDEARRMLLIR